VPIAKGVEIQLLFAPIPELDQKFELKDLVQKEFNWNWKIWNTRNWGRNWNWIKMKWA